MRLIRFINVAFGGVLACGPFFFGAVESRIYYPLFLLLLALLLSVVWFFPSGTLLKRRFLPLLLIGLFLMAGVFFHATLVGRGYIIAGLGWLTLFLTLTFTAESEKATRSLLILLVLIGAVEALWGLLQTLGGYDYIGTRYRGQGRIATGTFINRNHFAALLNMTIPLALGWFFANFSMRRFKVLLRSELYAWAWIILLSSSLMGLALLLSFSRGGTLVLTLTLVFMALLLTVNRQSRYRKLGGAVIIMLLTVFSLGLWVGVDVLLARLGVGESDLPGRITLYRDTLRLIAASPIGGVGPGMFEWRFRSYESQAPKLLFTYAHNDYLQSAAEWGIPGAALFWWFVLWRFLRTIRLFFQSHNPWRQGMALGCSAGIFAILLHSLVDFNLQIPGNLMIFCTILGLSWSLELQRKNPSAGELVP